MTLSSAKISLTIRRLSEMLISGSRRRRMFAPDSVSSKQAWFAPGPQRPTVAPGLPFVV